jgi:hypothetical protein
MILSSPEKTAVVITTAAWPPGNMLGLFRAGLQRSASTRTFSAHTPCGVPKATLIYRRTGNLRCHAAAVGHTKIESTVRYLGIEVDDALAIAEQVDV